MAFPQREELLSLNVNGRIAVFFNAANVAFHKGPAPKNIIGCAPHFSANSFAIEAHTFC